MAKDPAILAHQEWLGYVQPVGLVVSIPALVEARAFLNRNYAPDHRRFLDVLPTSRDGEPVPEIADFPAFARAVFGWGADDLWGAPGAPALPASLEAPLPEYGETVRPTYALREFEPKEGSAEWILLVQELPTGADFDAVATAQAQHWQASPQARFERLLRETRIPAGLLVNGRQIRLVYAPRGEASGHITFNLADMVQVAGRPIFAALHMLLSAERLYSVAENERLPAILANSRKYQNVVSTQLAGQVLEALYELLRGFQAADDQTHGALLREVLARDPNHVYAGLLTTLLRLVFVLYAEDRGLISTDPVYVNYYSVTGLYERLRADAGRYPDTMDQRYGAWAQLLALFRLIYRGGQHGAMRIPPREGYLFDPDRYLFLEGRQTPSDPPEIPRVSDGVLYRVLSKLVVLEGERLSYRTLAVEQIGSVYEAIMGFDLRVAQGPSIAIRPAKKHGAPATVNLEELLRLPGDKRQKWLADQTDQKLTGQAADSLKNAATVDDLLAALDRKIARNVTPNVAPKGAMIFQPSNERRRSGSHYTPSTLTGPIVEAALRPVLGQLGEAPTPDQILNLKVCDPAMGSGAFLVEACRQLGEALVKAWHTHNEVPILPPDEDELLFAMRQVAQRCLYGVDKNPMAADLAKLSLWLATLAKDHPFTFLDHALRSGDSLVGFSTRQISYFHWNTEGQQNLFGEKFQQKLELVLRNRAVILEAPDSVPYENKRQQLARADEYLTDARMAGDALAAAFFAADRPRERERKRAALGALVKRSYDNIVDLEADDALRAEVQALHAKGVVPFHWEIEFPEVFRKGGFDAIVGNPPFAGKNTLIEAHAEGYLDWLKLVHPESHGNSDLVAHFFRRAFTLLRPNGCFGLIATNTIGQGDTRSTGLRWICTHGGTIYQARKRLRWPGQAAVVVSVVHVCKGEMAGPFRLDNRDVPIITAYLFHAGGHEDPARLKANEGKTFRGCEIGSLGFLVSQNDPNYRLLAKLTDPRSQTALLLKPYVGGRELNEGVTDRYVLDVDGLSAEEMARIPDALRYLEERVRPDLIARNEIRPSTVEWWHFRRPSLGLRAASRLERLIAIAQTSSTYGFILIPGTSILSHKAIGFHADHFSFFCMLQSRPHQIWAVFQGSTMKDDPVYAPEDCYETFPLPSGFESSQSLERAGCDYYVFRSELMQRENKGLTAIYSLFHDPECEHHGILKLRERHDAMDRAVLDAYGWTDIRPRCEFIPEFDDEDEEDENGRPRRKKHRYRWPDEIRDEVLARLLELNRQRALEEGQLPAEPLVFAGASDADPAKASGKKKRGRKARTNLNLNLLPQGEDS